MSGGNRDKTDSTDGMEFIDQEVREDSHEPIGDHINYEVKVNLQSWKDGRQVDLSNTHIPLDRDK